jgi:hypothetical protein
LNDFAAGKYSIRIGQASTGNWYYSGLFTFNGTGSSKPICKFLAQLQKLNANIIIIAIVSTATSLSGTAAAAAAAATGNPAASGNAAAIGKAAASGSAASASATALSTKSAANTISINSAALALGAVAAAAFAL